MSDKHIKTLEALGALSATQGEPVHLSEDPDTGSRFLIYATDQGVRVDLRYEGDALWMTQAQIADLFGRTQPVISRHISNILDEGELDEAINMQKMHINPRGQPTTFYSLNMVISVGYRVSSKQATAFRIWATQTLVQFATKGFVVDADRLKRADHEDHFTELREIIRDIRASEANVYREVRRICSLCNDYGLLSDAEKNAFFASIQNKLHYAVTSMTGAEIRLNRADASQPDMGLTSWSGDRPIQKDVLTAKNFLAELEIRDLNRFTGMLLDYFEQETELRRLVSMDDARSALDKFIKNNERPFLHGKGAVSRKAADAHCKTEYKKFSEQRRKLSYQEPDGSD